MFEELIINGKTVYDYFNERLSMLPNELDNIKVNDEALSLFIYQNIFSLIFYFFIKFW